MSPGCLIYHDGQHIAQWSHSLYYSNSQFFQMHELLLVTSSLTMIESDNIADTGILGNQVCLKQKNVNLLRSMNFYFCNLNCIELYWTLGNATLYRFLSLAQNKWKKKGINFNSLILFIFISVMLCDTLYFHKVF